METFRERQAPHRRVRCRPYEEGEDLSRIYQYADAEAEEGGMICRWHRDEEERESVFEEGEEVGEWYVGPEAFEEFYTR